MNMKSSTIMLLSILTLHIILTVISFLYQDGSIGVDSDNVSKFQKGWDTFIKSYGSTVNIMLYTIFSVVVGGIIIGKLSEKLDYSHASLKVILWSTFFIHIMLTLVGTLQSMKDAENPFTNKDLDWTIGYSHFGAMTSIPVAFIGIMGAILSNFVCKDVTLYEAIRYIIARMFFGMDVPGQSYKWTYLAGILGVSTVIGAGFLIHYHTIANKIQNEKDNHRALTENPQTRFNEIKEETFQNNIYQPLMTFVADSARMGNAEIPQPTDLARGDHRKEFTDTDEIDFDYGPDSQQQERYMVQSYPIYKRLYIDISNNVSIERELKPQVFSERLSETLKRQYNYELEDITRNKMKEELQNALTEREALIDDEIEEFTHEYRDTPEYVDLTDEEFAKIARKNAVENVDAFIKRLEFFNLQSKPVFYLLISIALFTLIFVFSKIGYVFFAENVIGGNKDSHSIIQPLIYNLRAIVALIALSAGVFFLFFGGKAFLQTTSFKFVFYTGLIMTLIVIAANQLRQRGYLQHSIYYYTKEFIQYMIDNNRGTQLYVYPLIAVVGYMLYFLLSGKQLELPSEYIKWIFGAKSVFKGRGYSDLYQSNIPFEQVMTGVSLGEDLDRAITTRNEKVENIYEYGISSWIYIDNVKNANSINTLLSFSGKPSIVYSAEDNSLKVNVMSLKQNTQESDDAVMREIYTMKEVPLQRWHHIVVNMNNDGKCDVFVNNELVATKNNIIPATNQDNFEVGEAKGISGGIANVDFYKSTLSETYIHMLYYFERMFL